MNESEHRPHPLLPWLESVAVNARHLVFVAYAPREEFERKLDDEIGDIARMVDPLLGHSVAQKNILNTYLHSKALAVTIAGDGGSELSEEELHALVYTAANVNPYVEALCDATADVFRPDFLNPDFLNNFRVAMRLPGFKRALVAWAQHFDYHLPFNGPDKLMCVNREMVEIDHPESEFWLTACQRDFSSSKDFRDAFIDEAKLATDALRNKEERAKKLRKDGKEPRPPARFKHNIARWWIPASLWARKSAGIAHLLDPRGGEGEDRVKRDISALGFSASHRGEWQDFIDMSSSR